MPSIQSRRNFLASLSAAGAAGVLGTRRSLADNRPPETTAIRLAFTTAICFAPFDVAETFLRAEGFTDVQYVRAAGGFSAPEMIARGEVDFGVSFAGTIVYYLDMGLPITALGGLHAGCYELFAREPIRSISDLKGRRVGIQRLSNSGHLYVSIMAKHVGLDPKEDIEWVVPPSGDAMQRFVAGETDAFLGFPPEPQELRARGFNRVIVSALTDRPWSQYFCCMIAATAPGPVSIRSRPSVSSARRSRQPRSARPSPRTPRDASSMAGSRSTTTTPSRRSGSCPTRLWREYDPEDP